MLRNRGLDRKLPSIGPQPRQHHLSAHSSRCRAGSAELLDVRAVSFPIAVWNELLEGLSKNGAAQRTENALGGLIECDDALILVDCHLAGHHPRPLG